MQLVVVLVFGLFVATSDGEVFSSNKNSQSQEVSVVQPEPVQPEPVQPEKASELNIDINEEGMSWVNIILYILGAIVVIVSGMYFFTRKQSTSPLSATESSRQEFTDRKTTTQQEQERSQEERQLEPQEQEPSQEERQLEPQEQEPSEEENKATESTEDDSSDNNK